jgi:hypothetical protein
MVLQWTSTQVPLLTYLIFPNEPASDSQTHHLPVHVEHTNHKFCACRCTLRLDCIEVQPCRPLAASLEVGSALSPPAIPTVRIAQVIGWKSSSSFKLLAVVTLVSCASISDAETPRLRSMFPRVPCPPRRLLNQRTEK